MTKRIHFYFSSYNDLGELYGFMGHSLGDRQFHQMPHIGENSILLCYFGKLVEEEGQLINKMMQTPNGPLRCLICSNAFGMGINVPDVEVVIHWGASQSMQDYWQEVGRAGRDGRQSQAFLYAVKNKLQHVAEDFKTLLKDVNSGKQTCFRHGILQSLSEATLPQKQYTPCSLKCNQCSCCMCMCCTFCKHRCPCSKVTS